jgi:hypothetical protein
MNAHAPAYNWSARFFAGGVLVVFVWLGWTAVPTNLALTCHWKQWPESVFCPDKTLHSLEVQVQELVTHLSRNPGDSLAYADFARYANLPKEISGFEGSALLAAAARTNPFDGTVLRLQAAHALQEQDWGSAVSRLTLLSERYSDSNARVSLATLIAHSDESPELFAALFTAAQTNQDWLEKAVREMPAAQLPVARSTKLIGRLAQKTRLSPSLGQFLIQRLKAEGARVDAHAIWMNLWNEPLGLLYNGDFEKQFVSGAFDWEVNDKAQYKAGALVSQTSRGGFGQVLRIHFSGRQIRQPIVTQDLMLPTGQYRFEGYFLSMNLQSNEGLAWVFLCGKARKELARTTALSVTGHNWMPFKLSFDVPDECGTSVSIELQTQAPYEAKTGLRGDMLFDRFTLARE